MTDADLYVRRLADDLHVPPPDIDDLLLRGRRARRRRHTMVTTAVVAVLGLAAGGTFAAAALVPDERPVASGRPVPTSSEPTHTPPPWSPDPDSAELVITNATDRLVAIRTFTPTSGTWYLEPGKEYYVMDVADFCADGRRGAFTLIGELVATYPCDGSDEWQIAATTPLVPDGDEPVTALVSAPRDRSGSWLSTRPGERAIALCWATRAPQRLLIEPERGTRTHQGPWILVPIEQDGAPVFDVDLTELRDALPTCFDRVDIPPG